MDVATKMEPSEVAGSLIPRRGRAASLGVRVVDVQLVERAQRGDREAFTALAAGALSRMNAVARLILGDRDQADDAVQDALVDAWRDVKGLRHPDRFGAWLDRLLVHSCYEHARRRSRRRVREIHVDAPMDVSAPDGQASLAASDQLERGLRALPIDQRTVVVLVYYLDRPLDEVASLLGIPVGTVKSRVHRALAALRAAVDADDRGPVGAQERFA